MNFAFLKSLKSREDEIPLLKRHQSITFWAIVITILVIHIVTYFPLQVPVNHLAVSLVLLTALFTSVIILEFLQADIKHKSPYAFRTLELTLGLCNGIFVSAVVLFTGGIFSPFWFLYIMTPVASALNLPSWAILLEVVEAVALYLVTVLGLGPLIFGTTVTYDFLPYILIMFMGITVSCILVYHLAEILMQENKTLTAERNKLSTILTSINDGVIVLDRQFRITFLNDGVLSFTGRTKDELIGRDFSVLAILNKEDQRLDVTGVCQGDKVNSNTVVYKEERLSIIQPDKQQAHFSIACIRIKEEDLLDIGCICIMHDKSKEFAEEDMKLDFVSMAAHELRTPLTSIRGYTALLKQRIGKSADAESLGFINRLEVSSNNLSNLVDNLLSVSRIEHNTFQVDRVPLDLKETINQVVKDLTGQAVTKKQALTLDMPDELPLVMADEYRISQVLTNLIANAVNYTPVSGSINVTVSVKDDAILIAVADTGEGIPDEALPKLFSKFFRVSGQLEQGSKGNGLGLFISKSIIELHQGKILVDSTLGKGSTFTIMLPAALQKEIEDYCTRTKDRPKGIIRGFILNKDRPQPQKAAIL